MMATELSVNPNQIQSFFNEIESQKKLLTRITELHQTLTTRLTLVNETLTQKSETLDSQIRSFTNYAKDALQTLQNRENVLLERESAMAAAVEGRKASAIETIESSGDSGDFTNKSLAEVLRIYCRRMEASRLVKFLIMKRKESAAIRAEMTAAATEAVDSMRLVLDAIEEFVGMKVEGKVGMADRRWACGLLIQAVLPIEDRVVTAGRSLKERATGVLQKWKGVLGGGEGSNGVGASEATMFLQMVIGFGLKERFDEVFLRKLISDFASRRDMPKLALALGFGDKIIDIINELVRSEKEVEAVYFASESGLTEKFPPLLLLKSCLRKCRQNANEMSRKGTFSTTAVEKANNSELQATKAIIRCVEDHKLESQFPTDNLKKRITQLEKAKVQKKKATASTGKLSNKRVRGSSNGRGSPSLDLPLKTGRFANVSPSYISRNSSRLHQGPPAGYCQPYSFPGQSIYESPGPVPYTPRYGGDQSPVPRPQQYGHAAQELEFGSLGTATTYGGQVSYGGQSNYSAYDFGATAPAYPPTYPSV